MKNILLILVGGTICTDLTEHGTLAVSGKAGLRLISEFKNSDSLYKASVEFTVSKNLGILSENMTVDKWNLIIKTNKEEISKVNFDGVIFAHGTDTLAYSASLFSILLSGTDIPVLFASSNARLGTSTANGSDNFKCAVELICRGITPDVYVPYKNISDCKMYLHKGSRIRQCENYSDDFFSSGAIDITNLTDVKFENFNEKLKKTFPKKSRKPVWNINDEIELKNNVLLVNPYVGIDYSAYDYKKFSAVLHGSYHCGTACVEKTEESNSYGKNSILYMLDECAKIGVDAYITPTRQVGEFYDTIRIMANHSNKINFLYGTTQESAYVKLLTAYSMFNDKDKISAFMQTNINFEMQ